MFREPIRCLAERGELQFAYLGQFLYDIWYLFSRVLYPIAIMPYQILPHSRLLQGIRSIYP